MRPFLVAYENASWLRQSGFADVKVDEGLLQGDPASPAFAQLIYGACCDTVQTEIPVLDLLLSYFDDLAISDEPETALAALEKLIQELKKVGLMVNLSKCVAYVTNPKGLRAKYRRRLKKLGIPIQEGGAVYVGSPFGSEAFIRQFLRKEADRVCSMLSELAEYDALSRVDPSMANAQGLYALAHSSLNHLLRHLMRTVEPRLIVEEFARVDTRMQDYVAGLFHAALHEISDWHRLRLSLPLRNGGLGITSLTDCSHAAYLGCLHRHKKLLTEDLKTSPGEVIKGFSGAYDSITEVIGEGILPKKQEFFAPTARRRADAEKADKASNLGDKIMDKVWEVKVQEMKTKASTFQEFVQMSTASSTCTDIFRAPIWVHRYRVRSAAFVMWGRKFLSLPICPSSCAICEGSPITQDGQHASGSKHCTRRVRERHDAIRDEICGFLNLLRSTKDFPYHCTREVPLNSIEGLVPEENGRPLICDFMLEHEFKAEVMVFDVRITHPNFEKTAHRQPFAALEENWQKKRKHYLSNYKLKSEQIQPVVFDTYGGWHKATLAGLFKLTKQAATRANKVDEDLTNELWLGMRYRIATVLVEKQYKVVEHLNWRLRGLHTESLQAAEEKGEEESEEEANYSGNTGTGVDLSAPATGLTASPGEDMAE